MNFKLKSHLIAILETAHLPTQYLDRLVALNSAFDLRCDWFDLLDTALKHPALFSQRPEALDENVTQSAALMGLPKAAFVAVAVKEPSLICQRPEALDENITRSAALMGLPKAAFVAAAVKKPSLFSQRPEALDENVTRSAALLGLTKGNFVAAAVKHPALFYQRPETLHDNVTRSAALMGMEKATFTAAAVKQPSLFSQRPETLHDNVTRSAALMGMEKEAFIAAAVKQPSLFSQRPETLAKKFMYLAAIASSRNTDAATLVQKMPFSVCLSTSYLHLRYVLALVVAPTRSASTLLTMPSTKAEALAITHFAKSPRTLQFMRAAGLIKTLPLNLTPISRTRIRELSLGPTS